MESSIDIKGFLQYQIMTVMNTVFSAVMYFASFINIFHEIRPSAPKAITNYVAA